MYAKGITVEQLKAIGEDLGIGVNAEQSGNRVKFTLRWLPRADETDCTYRHKSINWQHERWTRSVCFHGHWDFIFECFLAEPDCTIESSWYGRIVYTSETFERKAKELAHKQIGAPIMGGFPSMIESCDCGAMGYGIVH